MSRYIKRIILIAVMIIPAFDAFGSNHPRSSSELFRDTPLPWGAEMPLPWRLLDGAWVTYSGNQPLHLFRFTVVRNTAAGEFQLNVKVYDPVTKKLLCEGVGHSSNDRIIYLQVGLHESASLLTIRFFSETEYPITPVIGENVGGGVLVLSMWNLKDFHQSIHMNLGKLK